MAKTTLSDTLFPVTEVPAVGVPTTIDSKEIDSTGYKFIVKEDGTVKIETIEEHDADFYTQLYNFILDGDHTYLANGYVVHNGGGGGKGGGGGGSRSSSSSKGGGSSSGGGPKKLPGPKLTGYIDFKVTKSVSNVFVRMGKLFVLRFIPAKKSFCDSTFVLIEIY